jgi:trypsin
MRFASFLAVALPALVPATPTPHEAIVGGTLAASGEFPFIVSLQRSGSHFCGGSLLDATTVITAAHCFVDSVTNLRVRAGSLASFSYIFRNVAKGSSLHYKQSPRDYGDCTFCP